MSDTSKLLGDPLDGQLVHDENDLDLLYDEHDPPLLPPIPGLIDPVGGPIGGPVAERVYLVDSPSFSISGESSDLDVTSLFLAVGNHPIMGQMFAVDPEGVLVLNPYEFRFASDEFVSRADDPDEASRYWDGRVLDPGSISLTLPLVPVGEAAVEASVGQIVLGNGDGLFDTVLDNNMAISQPIEVKLGTRNSFVGDFVTVVSARITALAMTEAILTISLRDPAAYAQNLYPTSAYGGGGGADGDSGLAGTVRPVVLGRVWNMAPLLINAVSLIYQAHDGAIAAVTGCYDGGAGLAFSADHATYAALAAATVSAGQYATCLAEGLIRVGSTPVFAITAHIDGLAAAGTSIRSVASWLAGQMETAVDLDVDTAAFAGLPLSTVGWVWREPFSWGEALSRFVGDAGWHWGADVTGPITTRRLDPPSSSGVAAVYDETSIMSIERTAAPDGYEGVHHRRIIRYGRNWTVQDGALAATAVEPGRRQTEWRQTFQTRSPGSRNAIDPPVLDTALATDAAAGTLADHLLDLHGTYRRFFTLATPIHGALPRLGDTVSVVYPRFGLASGGLFRILDIDLRLQTGMATLLLWG